ncbi:glutamyl-tRNA reductase [Neisseria sp. Ec49-e6-T10]|uniref:glutamyl-tRNA reductase n=1 Tax=Neisseria sp. Ec49-e6-T10 TaxID=3140744 RepID=UPI003EBAB7C6
MSFITIGLNHQTAPVSVRERLAFTAQMLPEALQNLVASGISNEAVILSTCNRTEIYCVAQPDELIQWLSDFHNIPTTEIKPFLYTLKTQEAIRHAFRVASGLDSMVLGEPQILGQIKDAVMTADQAKALGPFLNVLFQKTFSVAKNVRSTTAVGKNVTSMAAASVKMAEQIFPSINQLNILLIGAGEMIELVATHFAAKNPKKIGVVNRTLARAQELCSQLNTRTEAYTLTQLPQILSQFDVVVSSTASPLPIVGKGMVERALKERKYLPIFLLDLAVPRDIESEVEELEDAFLYTVDDIASLVEENKEARQTAAAQAESIITEKVEEFISWQQNRRHVPYIRALKEQSEHTRLDALNHAKKQLQKGMDANEVLEQLSVQLTNKLLHLPTKTLNHASEQPDLAEAIIKIYQLSQK